MSLRSCDTVMLRLMRLHNDPPCFFSTSRPSRHLREQLKGPFSRPEIRNTETGIGPDDSDQGHMRKMMPLGDHLRSHQDIYLKVMDRF